MEEEKVSETNGSVVAFANITQNVVDFFNTDIDPIGNKFKELLKKIDEQSANIDEKDEEIRLQLEETRCFLEDMLGSMREYWQQGRMSIESNLCVLKSSGKKD